MSAILGMDAVGGLQTALQATAFGSHSFVVFPYVCHVCRWCFVIFQTVVCHVLALP
jgi:hypothetical protein